MSLAQLRLASESHIADVAKGLEFMGTKIIQRGMIHDFDKLRNLDGFHADFQTGFKRTEWWDEHRKLNRHHIDKEDGVRDDVNLVDVIEHIVDCVMAGMARSGSVYDLKLPDELLQRAFKNTVEDMKAHVEVEEGCEA